MAISVVHTPVRQTVQSFIGNGDVSKWIKIFRVWRKTQTNKQKESNLMLKPAESKIRKV